MSKQIQYPYLPEGKEFKYVTMKNKFMQMAMEEVVKHDKEWGATIGATVVKDGEAVVVVANGNDYHQKNGCDRKRDGIANGNYDYCPGCSYKDHSEPKAARVAQEKGIDIKGADIYIWGHWWVCEPCWKVLIDNDIKNVYLLENSEKWFNRESSELKRGDYDFFRKME
ncbi:MAG: hypothetical protein WCJ58_04520 [bacterium]